jgi:hypothetical protein
VSVHEGLLIHRNEGFGRQRSISEGAVWTDGLVVTAPLLDEDLCLAQRVEDLAVEVFIPEPRIEALDVAVFPG